MSARRPTNRTVKDLSRALCEVMQHKMQKMP